MFSLSIQKYKDKESTFSFEQKNDPEASDKNTGISNDDKDYYQKMIMSLKEEIKTLNDELALVLFAH